MDNKREITIWQLLGIAYLALPNLLFFFYLHSLSGMLGVIGLIIIAVHLHSYEIVKSTVSRKTLFFILFLAVVICFVEVEMGWLWGVEVWDWYKHNTILNDLINYRWPVVYESGAALNYYLAYYLPAAVFGKLASSFFYAKVFLSAWTVLSLFLGFVNLLEYTKPNVKGIFSIFLVLFLFSMYSGWDWLSWKILRGAVPAYPTHLEWPINQVSYQSFMTCIRWSPQHFLPSLLGVPLILSLPPAAGLFLISTSIAWSPFAALGLGYIWMVNLLIGFYRRKNADMNLMNVLPSVLISLPVVLFMSLHFEVDIMPFIAITLKEYLVFICCEVLILVAAILLLWQTARQEKILLSLMVLVLLVLPPFKFGHQGFNDFVMRTSAPLLVAVVSIILKNLFMVRDKKLFVLVVILLLGGVLTPIHEIGDSIMRDDNMMRDNSGHRIFPMANSISYLILFPPDKGPEQYLGYSNLTVLDWLHKPL